MNGFCVIHISQNLKMKMKQGTLGLEGEGENIFMRFCVIEL
jgi:hypothetical protein